MMWRQRSSSQRVRQALRRGRTRFRPIELVSRAAGIKPIIRAMRRGLPYFMLPDLDFGARDALFVPFFGVPASTLTAPARIAAATGVPLSNRNSDLRDFGLRQGASLQARPGGPYSARTVQQLKGGGLMSHCPKSVGVASAEVIA